MNGSLANVVNVVYVYNNEKGKAYTKSLQSELRCFTKQDHSGFCSFLLGPVSLAAHLLLPLLTTAIL